MSNRFYIKDEGIVDRNRNDKRLTLFELWNSLNALDCIADKNVDEYSYIKRLECENEQLKKRNNNQYNQLSELWEIIEEENWGKLIAMKKQLKEDEERLQQEWRTYE